MIDSIPPELISAARGARAVAALTGAGVSAESGIPISRVVDWSLRGSSGQILPLLVQLIAEDGLST